MVGFGGQWCVGYWQVEEICEVYCLYVGMDCFQCLLQWFVVYIDVECGLYFDLCCCIG